MTKGIIESNLRNGIDQENFEECDSVVKDVEELFYLGHAELSTIVNKMTQEMKKGLGKDTNSSAKVKMIPSFVESLPDGTELGNFLALDLGGTNFRVLLVKIVKSTGNLLSKIEMDSQIYHMSQDVITGTGTMLFDHIAQCMSDFLERFKLRDEKLPVGFTFSFPCKQQGLDHASLITWTKGFTASGVVGEDVVQLLREAIQRRGDFDCELVAVVNDTVGTLMSCAYENPNCQIGLIVGTGSNACYMEKKSNVELIEGNSGDMCINMEWGAFGDDGVLDEFRNEYDEHVDSHSLNAGKQKYEKMISGMYMGEIVRLVLCKLTEEGTLFNGIKSKELFTEGSFESSYVSQIESASKTSSLKKAIGKDAIPDGMIAVQNILTKLGVGAIMKDCEIVTRVCQAVSKRAASLCAAGIAAVARKIKDNQPEKQEIQITVGVDGTVYKKHPTFKTIMAEKVRLLCEGSGVNVDFALSYDGSGKGAALVTAVAHRLQVQNGNGVC